MRREGHHYTFEVTARTSHRLDGSMGIIRAVATPWIYVFTRAWIWGRFDAEVQYRRDGSLRTLASGMSVWIPPFRVVEWVFPRGTTHLEWVAFRGLDPTTYGGVARAQAWEGHPPKMASNLTSGDRSTIDIERCSSIDPRVAWVKSVLDQSFADTVSVSDLAQQCRVSREHLTRCFRQQVGLSPQEYLQQLRLEDALHHLQFMGGQVTDVVLASGSGDISNFYHRFRSAYQRPPAAFRP